MVICHKLEIIIFDVYVFDMDISLFIALICLKICIHIGEISFEGRVSQNFDKCLSFCFMGFRRWGIEKNYQKNTKVGGGAVVRDH